MQSNPITLNDLLEKTKNYKMNAQEIEEQFISFIIGNAPEGHKTTRKAVRNAIKGV